MVSAVDAPSIYDIPKALHTEGLDAYVVRRLGLPFRDVDWSDWDDLLRRVHRPWHSVTIALVGKYVDLPDAYLSPAEALRAGGSFANDARVNIRWVTSDDCQTPEGAAGQLADVDGVLVPGGFRVWGIEGKLGAIRYARENGIPLLGLCLGLQCAAIEVARDVADVGHHDQVRGRVDRGHRAAAARGRSVNRAPAMTPVASAAISAGWSTTPPRAVLTRIALGSHARERPGVDEVARGRGQRTVEAHEVARHEELPRSAWSAVELTVIPKPSPRRRQTHARCGRSRRCRARRRGRRRRARPRAPSEPSAARASPAASNRRRAAASSRAKARSAVASVSTSGVTPHRHRCLARRREVDVVGPDRVVGDRAQPRAWASSSRGRYVRSAGTGALGVAHRAASSDGAGGSFARPRPSPRVRPEPLQCPPRERTASTKTGAIHTFLFCAQPSCS